MALSNAAKGGVALFLGVVQFGILLIVGEAIYPGYSIADNRISDLGPRCQACPSQTSSIYFDTSIILVGVLVLVAAYFTHRSFRWKPFTALVAVAGIGAMGLGIFPEGSPYGLHGIFSLVVFLGIGLSAVVGSRFQKSPLSYFSVILGLISLAALLLYVPGWDTTGDGTVYGPILGIGPGGLERMIVYPVLLWALAFGGHLMGMEDKPKA